MRNISVPSLFLVVLAGLALCQLLPLQAALAQQSIVPTKNFSLSTTTIRNSDGENVLGLSLNGNTTQIPAADMTVEQALALRDAQSQAALAERNATSSDDPEVVGKIISNNIVSQEASRFVQGAQTASETQANINEGLSTLEQPQLNVGQIEPILSSADLDFERELLGIPTVPGTSSATTSSSSSSISPTNFGSGIPSGTSGSTLGTSGTNIGGGSALNLDGGQASSAFQSTSQNTTRSGGVGRKQVYKYSKANKRKFQSAAPSYVHTPYESTF